MYDAIDVARYVINISHEFQYSISNLKLQKLLYFIQAVFLVESEGKSACFKDEIEAWDFGPVVPVVYREFKFFGGTNIPKIEVYRDFSRGIWNIQTKKFNEKIIFEEDRDNIKKIVKHFGRLNASKLVDITHHQLPWVTAYKSKNKIISKKCIYDYFKEEK